MPEKCLIAAYLYKEQMSRIPTQISVKDVALGPQQFCKLVKVKGAYGSVAFEKASEETEIGALGNPTPNTDPTRSILSILDHEFNPRYERVFLLTLDTQILLHLRYHEGIRNDDGEINGHNKFAATLKAVDDILKVRRSSYEPLAITTDLEVSRQMLGLGFGDNDEKGKHRYKMMCDIESGRRCASSKQLNNSQLDQINKALQFLEARVRS